MTGWQWIAVTAALGLILGLGLMRLGRAMRQRRGLGDGETVSLDRVTLTSPRYGLTGTPDRLIRSRGMVIPEEWKSARVLKPWHRAQMGVYFLLIEDQLGVIPPHGFHVSGGGARHRIENTAELRTWVLALAGRIRESKSVIGVPVPVVPKAGRCRPCGMLGHCDQARI